MVMLRTLTGISLTLLVALRPPAALADERADLAITDVTVIEDFPFQGEYRGRIRRAAGTEEMQTLGLQVVALGGGQFEAVQLAGGLPGAGWDGSQRQRLAGQHNGARLRLGDDAWHWVVTPHQAQAYAGKTRLGRLTRVQRRSPTLGAPPPQNALVLFDGSDVEQLARGTLTVDGLLVHGAEVRPVFQDFSLHIEFLVPFMPYARGQGRGNSGLYLQSRYEVQVLDSFGLPEAINGSASLYRFRPPDVNMCYPPLSWQTLDIDFSSPRWNSDGTKRLNARITVRHNGVRVHDRVELPGKTGAGAAETGNLLPIRLQDHGNPVSFRNFWVVDRGLLPGPAPTRDAADPPADMPTAPSAPPASPDAPPTTPAPPKKDQPPLAGKSAEEKPAEEKPAEEKPAEEKRAEEKPAEEKPAEEKPAEEKPNEEKTAADKPARQRPSAEPPPEKEPDAAKPPAEESVEENRGATEGAGQDSAGPSRPVEPPAEEGPP